MMTGGQTMRSSGRVWLATDDGVVAWGVWIKRGYGWPVWCPVYRLSDEAVTVMG